LKKPALNLTQGTEPDAFQSNLLFSEG